MKKERWIIETWTGRHVFTDRSFPDFQSARDFISDEAHKEAEKVGVEGDEAYEEVYNGLCEDWYAIQDLTYN